MNECAIRGYGDGNNGCLHREDRTIKRGNIMFIRKSTRLEEDKDNSLSQSVSEKHAFSKELPENNYEEPTVLEKMENSDSIDVIKNQNGDFYISLS